MPINEKIRATCLTWSDQAGVVMLLFFYVAAFVYPPGGMPHSHHEDDIHHGDSCIKDACHIAIFHPGGEGGCDHKFHFTENVEECDLCHSLLPRQVMARAAVYAEFKIQFSQYTIHRASTIVTGSKILHADRGPPFLI